MHFSTYQNKLEVALRRGNATENTHRTTLQNLIEDSFEGISAVNEPRREKYSYNAPDYVVLRGETQLGHIETKAVGANLNKVERSDQMKRYLKAFDNLVLTDYLEFRWYVRGDRRRTVRLAEVDSSNRITSVLYGDQQLETLLKDFVSTRTMIKSSKQLATRMAFFARQMREVILEAYADEAGGESRRKPLHEQLKSFKDILIPNLTPEQFADLIAQTLCYGLFAARMSIPDADRESNPVAASLGLFPARMRVPDDDAPLNRLNALYGIRSNPLLKNLFGHFAITDVHPDVEWALRDVESLLANAELNNLSSTFRSSLVTGEGREAVAEKAFLAGECRQ